MPSTAPWTRYDPRIRLVVDGKELPCIRCNVDYELNAIPQASATLAVGRDFNGNASPTHALASNFVDRAPAQIYITPNAMGQDAQSATGSGDLGLSGDEVRIFDGYVTAAGFTRSRGSAQFTVQMEHWLSEIGFSSVFSKSSHPGNPGQYSFGALSPSDEAGANWSTLGLGYKFIDSGKVTRDFWGESLLPFLKMLCRQDAFWSWDSRIKVADDAKNDGALKALNRFNSPCQQKLAMDLTPDADVVHNIMEQAGDAVSKPGFLANQTLWDLLIGTFASEYLFSVVPRVEDAIVAPFIPGYRKSFVTIDANAEVTVEWMRGLGRPLRGVGILAGVASTSGATMSGQGAPGTLGVGGFYTPDPTDKKGIIIIKKGPDWMTKLYAPSRYASDSSGASGKAIGTAVQPGGKKVNNVPDDITTRLKAIVLPFLDRFAQAHYVLEKLRTRQAVCSCPFRLDIAPGSTVLVENEGEQHITNDPLKTPFYGHVARVSISVDGEQPSIGTSFHLSHIRSAQENTSDKTSIAKHPLYKNTFSGCSLVD
jgi:hypothetical protein